MSWFKRLLGEPGSGDANPQPASAPPSAVAASVPVCPYCGIELAKLPKAKTACASCGKPIHVRASQKVFGRIYLTSGESAVVSTWWQLEQAGITAEQLRARIQRTVSRPGEDVAVRAALDLAKERSAAVRDPGVRQSIAWAVGDLKKRTGKPPKNEAKQAARLGLQAMKAQGVTAVLVITARDDDVCPACKALEGQTIAIGDAIRTLPVPARCTADKEWPDLKPGCRCTYAATHFEGRPLTPGG